jgi:hypothetical protein
MFLVEFTEELIAKWLRGDWGKTPVALLKKRGILVFKAFKRHYGE